MSCPSLHRPAFSRQLCLIALLSAVVAFCPRAKAQESVYNGAFAGGTGSLSNAVTFETNSGKGLSIINIFKPWSNGNNPFPLSTADGMRAHGSIPMITWQPNGSNTDDYYKLANIINGNFDDFITTWALDAKAWGHPFFLRFAHEMNGTWYPWSPGVSGNTAAQYVAMWRHVHDIFTRNGVTNVTWVWCVSTIYSGSSPIIPLYPGDNYVDWISLDSYNRITNSWADFSSRSQTTLDQITAIAPGKPIFVAETGCHEDDTYDKGQWFRNAMASYLKYSAPRIKTWCYFNGNNPDGNDWRIETSAKPLADYQFCAGLSYYSSNKYGTITDSPIQPLLNDATTTDTMAPFVSLATPQATTVQAGVTTDLRVLASDKSGVTKVEYSVNGTLARTATAAPYVYSWPVPAGTGKAYTVVAKAYDPAGNTATSTLQLTSKARIAVPSGVAASDGAYTDKVRVTWTAVAGALGYEVWRGTANDSTAATRLTDSPVTASPYDDTTTDPGVTFYYWVRALDDAGPSVFGTGDPGYRLTSPAPSAPTGVYATDGTNNSSTLVGWNKVGTATSYEIWRNTVSNSATSAKINSSAITGTSYSDTTGAYAQRYYYWVKAVNSGGTSAFSAAGSGYRGNLPSIDVVPTLAINQNTGTGPIDLAVDDNETPAASLTLSAASSNPTLVPTSRIVFGGSGANRTVAITPTANLTGTATITFTVTDADGGQATDTLLLTVNTPPAISTIADAAIGKNASTVPLAFTVSDAETDAANLVLTGSSSNGSLVPAGSIVFGGSGANRTVTVTPAANLAGSAVVTVTVNDGTGSASASFNLAVSDANNAYWTATGTGGPLSWQTAANWVAGTVPQSGTANVTYLANTTLPAGTISTSNNLPAPTSINSLTLAGTGPAKAAGKVSIDGSQLKLVALADGTAPSLNLLAAAGTGTGAVLTYALNLPLLLDATMTVPGDGTATFVAAGSITGAGGITKTGGGTLVLSGANTYAGKTAISGGTGGTLLVTSATGLGSAGTLQVNTGAAAPVIQFHIDGTGSNGTISLPNGFGGNSGIVTTFDVAGNGGGTTGNTILLGGSTTGWGNSTAINVTGANGYALSIAQLRSTGGSAGVQTLNPTTAPLTIGAYLGAAKNTTLILDGTNTGNAVTGTIIDGSAVVSLTKSNTGTWTLGGDNTYTGDTAISAGTLQIGGGGGTGSLASASAVSGADGAFLVFNRGNDSTFANTISGALALKQNGAGNTTITSANTYTGTTTINAGTLTIRDGSALGATSAGTLILTNGGQLALAGGTTTAEPITLYGRSSGDGISNAADYNTLSTPVLLLGGGNSYFVRSDAGRLTFAGGLKMQGSTAGKVLYFAGNGDTEVSGSIANDTGTLGVTKSGPGTLTFSGTNTYLGATTVSAGTLVLGSNLASTSSLMVASAGTLSGGGTVGTATTINGTHSPGAGIGSQTFTAALAYGGSSHLSWGLGANTASGAGTNFDAVNAGVVTVSGGAVVDVVLNGGGSAVNLTNAFWQSTRTWTVLTASSLSGSFNLGAVSNDSGGRNASAYGLFSVQTTGTAVNLVWTPFTPVQAWRYAYFGANWNNAAIAGDSADPDGDGMPNLLEYALGKSPVAVDATGIAVTRTGSSLSMTYTLSRAATDITVQPEWSTDFFTWGKDGFTLQSLPDDGTVQNVQASISTGTNSKLFVRLHVIRP